MGQHSEEIRTIEIPVGTVSIAPDAFRRSSFAGAVEIPEGVTKIGEGACLPL